MVRRGVIASYSGQGSGHVMVEGKTYPFTRERMWQSPGEPQVGQQVHVTFDSEASIASMAAVDADEAPVLATPANASALASPLDLLDLLAVLAIAASWFLLSAITVRLPLLGELHFTFWQILGHLDGLQTLSAQVESRVGLAAQLLAVASLLAALLPLVWRVRWARVGAFLPLAGMLAAAWRVRVAIDHLLSHSSGLMGQLSRAMAREIEKQMQIGLGGWIAVVAALWLVLHAVGEMFSRRK